MGENKIIVLLAVLFLGFCALAGMLGVPKKPPETEAQIQDRALQEYAAEMMSKGGIEYGVNIQAISLGNGRLLVCGPDVSPSFARGLMSAPALIHGLQLTKVRLVEFEYVCDTQIEPNNFVAAYPVPPVPSKP